MKRVLTLILSIVSIFCFTMLCFTACKTPSNNKPATTPKSSVVFIDAPQTMVVGESKKLVYVVDGEESALSFSSSNQSVAKIDDNANVEALTAGQTVITATYGQAKTEFTLTVVVNDGLPQLIFDNYINESEDITLTTNSKLNLSCTVLYNGKYFNDAVFTYNLSDTTVASIDANGTLTALKNGKATVTISASWRGIESPLLTKEISITIITDAQILVEDGNLLEIKLFTKGNHGGKMYETSYDLNGNAKFMVEGVDVTDKTTFSVENNVATGSETLSAVSYDTDANVLTAQRYGSANLLASASINGETVSRSIPIVVERPVYEYDETVCFSQVDGEIVELNDMFGGEITLTDAYQGGNAKTGTPLTVESNIISDYFLADINMLQNDVITVYTEDCGVLINVKAAYKVIRKASDLTSLYGNTSEAVTTTGYFLVANDIAYDSSVVIKPQYTNYGAGSTFKGVFDGNGHTIEYGINKGGLFGNLDFATVKNAAFVVKNIKAETGNSTSADLGMYAIIAGCSKQSKIENVFATYDTAFNPDLGKIGGNYRFRGLGLFACSHNWAEMYTDVVLDLSTVGEISADNDEFGYGVITAPLNGQYGYGTASNVHVIWDKQELTLYKGGLKVAYAANDTGYTIPEGYTATVLKGVTRYDTLEAMAEKVSSVGDFTITANAISWNDRIIVERVDKLGEILYDGEGTQKAILPDALNAVNFTKIVCDDGQKAYENSEWVLERNTSNEKVIKGARVYGANDKLLGIVTIVSVAKVITTASDLTSVYGNTTETVTTSGYFFVANDITYDSSVQIKPVCTGLATGSQFSGVFDGDGHAIEFGLNQGGLFGNLTGSAIIKNAAFIVKSVKSGTAFGQYAILAGWSNNGRVENVYAKYDVEFTADLKRTAVARSTGLGLFTSSNNWEKYAMADVIVDLSKVNITSSDGTYSYGVTVANVTSYGYGYGVQRTHVIWDEEKLLYDTAAKKIIYAENSYPYDDKLASGSYTYTDESGVKHIKLAGLNRYDTLADMAAKVSRVGNFSVTASGISWAK